VVDGTEQTQAVRQLIGLGPPNNGSALAELFHDPKRGEEIINRLTVVFVPKGFDPVLTGLYRMSGPEVRSYTVFAPLAYGQILPTGLS
jgi:hypothetical protein